MLNCSRTAGVDITSRKEQPPAPSFLFLTIFAQCFSAWMHVEMHEDNIKLLRKYTVNHFFTIIVSSSKAKYVAIIIQIIHRHLLSTVHHLLCLKFYISQKLKKLITYFTFLYCL